MERVLSFVSEHISLSEIKEINKEFRIKASLYEGEKRIATHLLGVSGLIAMVGDYKASVLMCLAISSRTQTPQYWMHKHTTKIQFYRK